MIIDFALMGLLAALSIPAISGYYAYTHGRSFWLWFVIGCFLPVVSYFILMLLPDRRNPIEGELDTLRWQLGLLGTRPEVPRPAEKVHLKTRNKSSFHVLALDCPGGHGCVEIGINGTALRSLVSTCPEMQRLPDLNLGEWSGLPLPVLVHAGKHLLGNPHWQFADAHLRQAALLTAEKGNVGKGALFVEVETHPGAILWKNFRLAASQGRTIRLHSLGTFVFPRVHYTDALAAVTRQLS